VTRYAIRVQRWVCYETTVLVEAETVRDAREKALCHPQVTIARGTITKNKTTILDREKVSP
jgi:hypothetical protein